MGAPRPLWRNYALKTWDDKIPYVRQALHELMASVNYEMTRQQREQLLDLLERTLGRATLAP